MIETRAEPLEVARMVEQYVSDQHRDAAKFSNRELLDEGGTYDLHILAGRIYALGFNDGVAVEGWRQTGTRQRERDAKRAEGQE